MAESLAGQGIPETGVEAGSKVVIDELCAEPDNEAILTNRIKSQNKDQKAV